MERQCVIGLGAGSYYALTLSQKLVALHQQEKEIQ